MPTCAHGSAPVGALPWAQPALCAPDILNFVLICNIADGLLDYTGVTAYLATHSQTNTYQSPQNRWHSATHRPPTQTFSYCLPCWIVALHHYVTWLSRRVWRFFVLQENLENLGAGVALRSAPQLWCKSLERSLMQCAWGRSCVTVTILALHFCIRALLRECLRDAAADSGFIGHQTIIGHQTTITVRCCNHCATAAPKCFLY